MIKKHDEIRRRLYRDYMSSHIRIFQPQRLRSEKLLNLPSEKLLTSRLESAYIRCSYRQRTADDDAEDSAIHVSDSFPVCCLDRILSSASARMYKCLSLFFIRQTKDVGESQPIECWNVEVTHSCRSTRLTPCYAHTLTKQRPAAATEDKHTVAECATHRLLI